MPEALFDKIVTDLGRNRFCNQFSPHRYGEPLADARMPALLTRARQAMPLAWIRLYTNGDLLSPELFERIDPAVDLYVITQHGKRMAPGLRRLFAKIGMPHPKIRFQTAADIRRMASNRGGLIDVGYTPRRACGVVMSELHIDAHGDVMLCCEDYLGEKVFGNVADMTIEEIWTQDERLRVHRANVEGRFVLAKCRTCGYGPMR